MNVEIIKRKRLLDDFFKVDEIYLKHRNLSGEWSPELRRLNFERGESVAVLIYVEDQDSFVLVRQFRFAVYEAGGEGWIDEIVAGILDEDDPLECAKRECIEETGYDIRRFESIGSIFVSPGATTERIHIYLGYCKASDKKYPGGGLSEEHEDIQVIELDRAEALQNLINGNYNDAKTILSLQYFFLNSKSDK